ncbi:hypothetical protein FKB34_02645 [Glycocaulis profundi]|nr:hypothetical protein FKB34_02645 [Glycocaulis profundi]
MRQFLASLLAAAGLGLAAVMAIAAIGPSVAADSEGRPPVYAAQCWLTLEDRGTDAVLVAHAAQGLSGSWELTVDGEALGGVFEGDGRNPALLAQADTAADPAARLMVHDESGRRVCFTERYQTRTLASR